MKMNKEKQSSKQGANIPKSDNYNKINLADWDDHIENSVGTKRQAYTLIQVNAPCKVNVTEKSHKKLAKIVLS